MSANPIKNLIKIQLPEKFEPFKGPARYKISYGGRGGGKSVSIAQLLVVKAIQSKIRILCTRELQKSITDSVHKLLSDIIQKQGFEKLFEITKTQIRCMNGSEFIFAGLRSNISEIKSMEGINIVWVEEAQKVSEESWQVLIPTIRADGSEIWVSFNPGQADDSVYRRFVLNPPPDSIVVKINYDDNPWFPETLRKEMEYDKRTDYEKYLHIWEGQPKTYTNAQIFKGKFIVDVFEAPKDAVFYFGLDFGFAHDPNILVRCYIQDRKLFIDYEAYGVGVDIDETPMLLRTVPGAEKYYITADSARPETISHLNRHGFRVRGSIKGKGSVEDGIAYLRGFEQIVIHERCKHVLDDFKNYSYKTDRLSGEVLPIPLDGNDHAPDALRYALEKLMKDQGDYATISRW